MNDFKLLVIIFALGVLSTVLIKIIIKNGFRKYISTGFILAVLLVIISASRAGSLGELDKNQYIEKINDLEKEVQNLKNQNSVIEVIRHFATYIMGVLSPVLTEWWGESIREARNKRKRRKSENNLENEQESKKKHKKRKKKRKD